MEESDFVIDFAVKAEYSSLVKSHNAVNEVLVYNGDNLNSLRKEIKSKKYDYILDLHNNFRTIFLKLFHKSKVVTFRKDSFKKIFLVLFKINLPKNSPPVYLKYIRTLKKIINNYHEDFTVSNLRSDSFIEIKKPFVLLAPSSKHFTKTYPKEKYLQYIKSNPNSFFVLTGSGSVEDLNICNFLDEFPNTLNLAGKTNFLELIFLVKNSGMVICNDSGILHLAEALNKKVFVTFGSTVKEFGFFPQLKSTTIFEIEKLKCRPCSHIGRDRCPKTHFKCMNNIILKTNENIS
jgi:heptosyltransferase-2